MVKYISYHLLNLDGAGYTPVHQAMQAGAEFSGGLWKQDEVYFGYLTGETEAIAEAVIALLPWRVDELTEAEALAWSEAALPINSIVEEPGGTKYIGPADVDINGYVQRPLSDTPWGV